MYYVTMTDRFMSGWGRAPRTNKLIFLCDDMTEAQTVEENARNRSDQKYINICGSRPKHYRSTMGSNYELNGAFVQIKTKADYPTWYEKGAF